MSQARRYRDQFTTAFVAAWEALRDKISERQLIDCFDEPSGGRGQKHPWTRCMSASGGVGKPDWPSLSVLQDTLMRYGEIRGFTQVAERIRWEESRLDMLLAGGDRAAWPGKFEFGWPASLAAIVEHERGEDLHTEIWKLLFWRADLKVLVCYDRGQDLADGLLSSDFGTYFSRCRGMVDAARAADNGFAPETMMVLVGRQRARAHPISSWIQLTFDSTDIVPIWTHEARAISSSASSPAPSATDCTSPIA